MLSTKINYFTLQTSMKELGTTFEAVDPDDSTAQTSTTPAVGMFYPRPFCSVTPIHIHEPSNLRSWTRSV
jgi:hypothetical protein